MKSNKNVKTTSNFLDNYSVTNNWKLIYIIVGAILALSLIVYCIFGLSLNYEFTGGTQLSVQIGAHEEADHNKICGEIENLLASKNISIVSKQYQGSFDSKTVIYSYQDVNGYTKDQMTSLNNEIREKINADYNTSSAYVSLNDSYDITRDTIRTSSSLPKSINILSAAILVFVATVSVIYFCIRFSVSAGLSSILGTAVAILLTFGLLALTRIPVGISFYISLFVVLLATVYNNGIYFDEIKQNFKDPALTAKTNLEIANMSTKNLFARTVFVFAVSVIIVLICSILLFSNWLFGCISLLIAVICSFFANFFIVPSFWALIAKQRKLVKPDTTAILTNDEDDDAPVIEVKD